MTLSIFLVLALLAVTVTVFAFEWLPVDVTTLLLLSVLVISGILTVEEAFAGFANEIIIILASVFVLSGALLKGGIMDRLGGAVHRLAGGSRAKIILSLMPVTAFVSAFMNNTTTTAVVTPAAIGASRRAGVAPSKVLIPVAFASMLGGTCTLIGTSTNVAASGFLRAAGFTPVRFFEFLPVGLAVSFAGILYMALLGSRFLPDHRDEGSPQGDAIREFLSEVVITAGSPLAGKRLRDSRLSEMGLQVLAIHRQGERLSFTPQTALAAGDTLAVQAARDVLLTVKETAGIEIKPDLKAASELLGESTKIVEALILPTSGLIGRTLKELDFRRRFGITALALYRSGHREATRLAGFALRSGDVLLLQGRPEDFAPLADGSELFVLEEVPHQPARRRKGLITVALFAAAVGLSTAGLLPLPIAFLLAALGVLGTRLLTIEEAYRLIDWRLLILIAGMTSFGLAMQKTGAATYVAQLLVSTVAPFGVVALLLAFAALTIALTQPMSNAAAALVVLPVALSTAESMGLSGRSFAIFITLCASLSFITPFEPSCLIVYGPGKYRFRDFVLAGLPLTALAVALLVVLVPLIWPLR